MSVNGDGKQATANTNWQPNIAGGGRFVTFASAADNLGGVDNHNTADVFIHDRETGATKLVSKTDQGVSGTGTAPLISVDGSSILFTRPERCFPPT